MDGRMMSCWRAWTRCSYKVSALLSSTCLTAGKDTVTCVPCAARAACGNAAMFTRMSQPCVSQCLCLVLMHEPDSDPHMLLCRGGARGWPECRAACASSLWV